MPIKTASASDIQAMKDRLKEKREGRLIEHQMDEAIQMATKKRPFAPAPKPKAADAAKAIAILNYGFLAGIGALMWNVSGNIYGLLALGVCALMACIDRR